MAGETKPFAGLRPAFQKEGVPDHMIDKLCGELGQGEKVLWIGRCVPDDIAAKSKVEYERAARVQKLCRGLMIGGCALAVVAFFGCGLVINFLIGALAAVATIIMGFAFGGIGMMITGAVNKSKYKLEHEQDTRPCYVVTSQRILIHCGTWHQDGGEFQQYAPKDLKAMQRVDSKHTEGVGDLIFNKSKVQMGGTRLVNKATGVTVGHRPGGTIEYTYGMMSIPKVKAVERLIRERLLGEKAG
jgi:hypothetical protein